MIIEKNENVVRLPKHLHKYIVKQNYSNYTSVNHAVWRYIMRISMNNLIGKAHKSYVDGLKITGISLEKIPDIGSMNQILSKIGWGAVCVDGFIPPAAFMEFQAYNVLVIAADIRSIKHVGYTPAPDIVHEAAGHGPIIADPEYAEYLRLFGEIGSKALRSKRDFELYEAIRRLSIVKENPAATDKEVVDAENEIKFIQSNMGEISELARIRNLHWWTVEYGLIGDIDNPKIYGAGLLSSISESATCLNDDVKKIPYSIDAANYSFDITNQQPQLFVTPSFMYLSTILNEFADGMALRVGGVDGIKKAIDSSATATCELSSGLQISGVFTKLITDKDGNPAYINTNGPTILCEREKMLIGHSTMVHSDGYGSPIGKLAGLSKMLENMRLSELESIGIIAGKNISLKFESGVLVGGLLHSVRKNKYGKILLMTFKNCTVTYNDEYLFKPEWGDYDMGVGESVVSVFAGAADMEEYDSDLFVSDTNTIRNSDIDAVYSEMYQSVRGIRETGLNFELLVDIFNKIETIYPNDWLLSLEIYELTANHFGLDNNLSIQVLSFLKTHADLYPENKKLILDGISLISACL